MPVAEDLERRLTRPRHIEVQLLGDLHPKLVHFPLVLLLAGLLFDWTGLIVRGRSEAALRAAGPRRSRL